MVNLKKFAFSVFFLPAALQAAPSQPDECTAQHPLVMVTARQPEFIVRLPSNPTTGYRWFLREVPDAIRPLSSKYVKPAESNLLVGSGGEEVWRFRVTATPVPRQWKLHFVYARPFETAVAKGAVCQVTALPAG